MYTQCPQCLTFFQVTPEHLRIAQGNVRCGQCRNVFSALGNLTEEPPEQNLEDSESELEEGIFIDEGELEDYAAEYPEEFYIEEEVVEEEYEEGDELYYQEEEYQEKFQEASEPPPIDVEETIARPVFAQSQHSQPVTESKSPAKNSSKSSKLSEAIATIEKLKQSYSNLPFRRWEKEPPPSKEETHTKPEPVIKLKPAAAAKTATAKDTHREHKQKPSSDNKKPTVTAKTKDKTPFPSQDIAIKHYSEEEDVDYDEALNALNDLKISDENDVLSEDSLGEVAQTAFQDSPAGQQDIVFHNDLHIDEADLVGAEIDVFTDENQREESQATANKVDIKVKSLNRRAKEESQKIRKPKPGGDKNAANTEAPKHLPAIPKQLMDDFHPEHSGAKSHFKGNLWALGSILLMVFFLGQTVYFKHNDLARLPQLRPWIETFCGYISCQVSLPSDVRQLELVSQDIRSHPKVKSALLVTTTIINNARYAQSYPGLQITFSDLNGQRVAMRRFAPHEYLSQNIQQDTGIAPNTPIQIELELMDPGTNAVNFEFDFIPLT